MPSIPNRSQAKPPQAEVTTAAVSSAPAAMSMDGAHYAKNPFMEKLSVTKFNYPAKAVANALFNSDDKGI